MVSQVECSLVLDATEGCVDVRVMRLEPVAKRAAQHACGGARRSAFGYIVLAVEEIRGVAGIEGHGRESGERRKFGARPFPAVTNEIVDTKSACARGMRTDRGGIPGAKIEIAVTLGGRFFSPGIAALLPAIRRPIRGAMELGFGGKLAAEPVGVGGGFSVADVHGPLLGEANLAKHRAIEPEIAVAAPERGMLDVFFGFPGPGFGSPERAVVVAAGLDESEEVVVGDVVAFDHESRHVHFMGGAFVVPAKFVAVYMIHAERGTSRRDFNQPGFHLCCLPSHFFGAANLFSGRHAMQHVGERFGMHQTMFDGYMEHGEQMWMAFPGALESALDRGIQCIAQASVVALDFEAGGPIGRCVFGQAAADGIDSKGKELIESRVEGAQAKRAMRQQIPVERLEVPDVENDAVPFRNGAVVQSLFANQSKKVIGLGAGVKQTGVQVVADADGGGESCSHGVDPFFRCHFREKDAPKIGVGRRTTLLCSRAESRLSIEMNAKVENFSGNLIEFREVSFHINDNSRREVISGISLGVSQGETLVLLGRSGSGKTTLLRLINAMVLPSIGQVLVQGRPTTDWDRIRLRRGIGYVIQEAGLFPHFTVAENVALVPTLEKWKRERIAERVGELLTLVGLDPGEFAGRHPRELSGGQRQRVGVARALAADPPILLMDEPFGALDPVTRAELQREFSALARRLGKTIVFVTHDLREALLLASRIVLLEAGRIVAAAPPGEFIHLEHPEVRAFTASFEAAPGALA